MESTGPAAWLGSKDPSSSTDKDVVSDVNPPLFCRKPLRVDHIFEKSEDV